MLDFYITVNIVNTWNKAEKKSVRTIIAKVSIAYALQWYGSLRGGNNSNNNFNINIDLLNEISTQK